MRTTDMMSFSVKEIVSLCKEKGVGKDKFLQAIAELYESGNQKKEGVYSVTVDYGLSLAKMIKAGKYDYVNSDINAKNFPVARIGKVEMKNLELVHLNCNASTDEAIQEIGKRGLGLGDLPMLLALGAKYPELQREFPVAALGSSWVNRDGFRRVACLWSDDGNRRLYLDWYGIMWCVHYRFLAVCK